MAAGFVLKRGRTRITDLPVTTSTAIGAGAIVTFSSGLLIAATSSTAAADHVGVLLTAITASDSDYATARSVKVQVPVERYCEWYADTASLVAGDIGAEVDLTDSKTVNRGATSIKVGRFIQVLSSTLGVFVIKFWGSY